MFSTEAYLFYFLSKQNNKRLDLLVKYQYMHWLIFTYRNFYVGFSIFSINLNFRLFSIIAF